MSSNATEEEFDRTSDEFFENWIKNNLHMERKLNGIPLKNVLAHFVGYEMRKFTTEKELKQLERQEIFAYDDNAEKHVSSIIKSMSIEEDLLTKMRILPILIHFNKKIVRLVVFQVSSGSGSFIVDTNGRRYDSYANWRKERVLPNGKISFIEDFIVADFTRFTIIKENVIFGVRRFFQWLDGIMLAFNVGSIVFGLIITPFFLPAGPIFLGIGVVTRLYGAARHGYALYDRYSHHQSISFGNSEARRQWLNLFGQLASAGLSITSLFMINLDPLTLGEQTILIAFANIFTYSNLVINAISGVNDVIYLSKNWNKLDITKRCFIIAQICFAVLSCMSFQTVDHMIADAQCRAVDGLINRLTPDNQRLALALRQKVGNLGVLQAVKAKTDNFPMKDDLALVCVLNSDTTLQSMDLNVSPNLNKLGDSVCDFITDLSLKKVNEFLANPSSLTENMNLEYLTNEMPKFVIDYAIEFCNQIKDEQKYLSAIIGILTSIRSSFPERYNEERDTTVNPNDEERGNFVVLAKVSNEQHFVKQWKQAINQFKQMSEPELKALLRYMYSNVGSLVKVLKLKKSSGITDGELKREILHGGFGFDDEPTAIYHSIIYSLNGNTFSHQEFFNDLENFLSEVDCTRIEKKNDSKYFIFQSAQPYGYAVVKYWDGCLSLCAFRKCSLK